MKIRRTFLIALTAVCLLSLSLSPSVFAATPKSYLETIDVGDEIGTARQIKPFEYFMGYLESPTDMDMFKWTNNTGRTVDATIALASPYDRSYDIWYSVGGEWPSWRYDQRPINNKRDTVYGVASGQTVYIMIADDRGNGTTRMNYVLTLQTEVR